MKFDGQTYRLVKGVERGNEMGIDQVKEMIDNDCIMDNESQGIPAPSPIEQRWTSASSSPMSPAHSLRPNDVFSWLGIIMYLPPDAG